jgi:hypothetical protein
MRSLVLVGAVLGAASCASVSFDDFKDVRASHWPDREEQGGLVVSVRPVVAPQEVEFFFGANLLDYDIFPVTVYLENRGDDTVTFQPDGVLLTCEDGTTLTPIPWRSVSEEVTFSYARAVPGFFFAVIPGFLILHSVAVANERLSHNYHRKALEEFSLPPGDHVQGVVFLKPPAGVSLDGGSLNGADMRLSFTRRTAQQTSPFEMFFHVWGIL